jgi:hypothetical protein
MKKASLLASAALATIALASAPAFAQGPFADVPADHWAYAAVDKLQRAGIVIGYPDQTYGGKRAMTRYEFAVAIARLLDKGIGGEPQDLSKYALKSDLDNYALKSDLDKYALKSDLAGLAKQSDLDALRQLVREFQTELTTLGVDLDAVKKRLDALEGRVKAIEDELRRVKITGSLNVYARGNHATRVDRDGVSISDVRDANGFLVTSGDVQPQDLLRDTRVLHDLDVTVTARISDTMTGQAVINYGNYLPFLNSIGSFSGVRSSSEPGRPGNFVVNQGQDFTIYKMAIEGPMKVPLVGKINLSAGRIPFQLTPYTFKLIDVDAYFYNNKTDLGDVPVDGIKAGVNLGPVGITGFAAKTDPIKFLSNISGDLGTTGSLGQFNNYGFYAGAGQTAYGAQRIVDQNGQITSVLGGFRPGGRPFASAIAPERNGAMAVEQFGGARLVLPLGKVATIGGTYIALAGQSSVDPTPVFNGDTLNNAILDRQSFNRVYVYGGDITTNIFGVNVEGAYTQTDTGGERLNANGTINTETEDKTTGDNYAWDAALSKNFGSLFLKGGYRFVGPFFGAPGSWARVGSFQNPVDIKGPYGTIGLGLGKNLSLSLEGQFYEGTGEAEEEGGLTEEDEITNFRGSINWKWSAASSLMLGAEITEYKSPLLSDLGGKPREMFYNIGYGYSFSPNAMMRLGYQYIDYNDKNTGFDPVANAKGGVATAAFSVKF